MLDVSYSKESIVSPEPKTGTLFQRGRTMFKEVTQINTVAGDIDKTVGFYTGILGFKVTERTRVQKPYVKETVHLALNNTTAELEFYYDAASAAFRRAGYSELVVKVDDMDKAVEYLNSKGVELYWGPDTFGQHTRAEIKDPDGLPVVLYK
jgi:glyoxylase I family protein